MTKFMSYYNLFMLSEPKDLIGIDADRDDGHIIVTLGKNMIIVIKISTQKQIRSWLVSEKLSTKVVYDRCSEKYVGVFGNRTIRLWDVESSDIMKCKKIKFKKSIADLVTTDNDTFVLYNDGTCKKLEEAIELRKNIESTSSQDELTSNYVISALNIWNVGDTQVLTYFKQHNITGNIELVRLNLQNGNEICFDIKRPDANVKVAGYAVIDGDDVPLLLTVWHDKRIFLLKLYESAVPNESPGNFVALISELQLEKPISLINMSKHFVAIYGANSGQEGASLILYNTKFKVVKAKQFFKIYFDISRLWQIKEHLLLAMGQNLSVVSYRMSKDLLADLIGTQISNDYEKLVDYDHINEEDPLQECLQLVNEVKYKPTSTLFKKEKQEVTEANSEQVPFESVQEFDSAIKQLSRLALHVDILEGDQELDENQILLMKNYNDDGFSKWPIQTIANQLERSGASEHEITEKILTFLIQADLLQDVGTCLRRYSNISEKMLSKALSYVLGKYISFSKSSNLKMNGSLEEMDIDVPELLDNGNKENHISNSDISEQIYQRKITANNPTDVLNVLLSCSFDENAIIAHIRREIDFPKLLVMLEHLYNLFTSTEIIYEKHNSFMPHSIDFEKQILRWFSVLLGTHFQQMALSKDEKIFNILVKWSNRINRYKREAMELKELTALFYNIVGRKTFHNNNHYSQWYSIEEVNLF